MPAANSLRSISSTSHFIQSVKQNPVPYFIGCWFLLNLLQVAFTELTSDEGYYWFYAQHLQWGYYDHPPMIAIMIKLGTYLFPGELGVRFFNVLFSTTGLALFFTLLPDELKRTKKTFFVLLSAPLLHYLTFLVFPDGPLLFFGLLFLVIYKRFLKRQDFTTALLMGLSLTLMAYSKYHGALVLFFAVLAYPRILKSGYFYFALLVAALFFIPHLIWQYQHDFPTLKYHLSGRTGSFSLKHVGEYISQQLVAIGPGLIFVPFVVKTKDVFERTLKFIIIGTLGFFLISSFKTFVHFHWTSIALYPLLYFAVRYFNSSDHEKVYRRLVLPFVVLFLAARILLIVPLIPAMHVGEDYYHGRKHWANEIVQIAGERPVLMPNNLREASLFSFYSNKQGITLYARQEKKSQYEIWGYEDSLQGREVMLVTKYPFKGSIALENSLRQNLHYTFLPSFSSYYTGVAIDQVSLYQHSDSISVSLVISNHRHTPLNFEKGLHHEPAALVYSLEKDGKIIRSDVFLHLNTKEDNIAPGNHIQRSGSIPKKDIPPGSYILYFGIRNGVLPDAILSKGESIRIK